MGKFFFTIVCGFLLLNLSAQKREFRAAWIATVGNIDWPSKPGLTPEIQKQEFISILNTLDSLNFNAVIVQVRPMADAFYQSKYEPWSRYLTNSKGEDPKPYYDPMRFMIDECHKRCMEFHAWINPFRVLSVASQKHPESHVLYTHPNWFYTYGTATLFNPGIPECRAYLNAIVKDILVNYDIDGLHMDDYFYPYTIAGKSIPDGNTYAMYNYKNLTIGDWRRENVNIVIKELSRLINTYKPSCDFGISPFGVWRNIKDDKDGSNTRAGQTNYDNLYADILLWCKQGWIDYVAPQLYWEFGHKAADYGELINWWSEHRYKSKLYVGLQLYRLKNTKGTYSNLIETQREIKASQEYNYDGQCFYSMKFILANTRNIKSLLREVYHDKALPPVHHRSMANPEKPLFISYSRSGELNINVSNLLRNQYLCVYESFGSQTLNKKLILKSSSANFKCTKVAGSNYYVSIVDEYQQESILVKIL